MIIVTDRLILDRRFNIDVGLIPICVIDGDTKVIVEGKIVKISTKAENSNTKKVLIGASLNHNEMRDTDNAINNTGIDKIIIVEGSKKEVCILSMLIIVISASGFIVNRCI